MEIKLKSNRSFILYIAIPFALIYCFFILFMLAGQIAGLFEIFDEPTSFISSVLFLICLIMVILYVKYHSGPCFLFTDTFIYVYQKNDLAHKIDVNNIEFMHYYPFRFHYFITILFGALMDGGAMKIHIKEKDGTIHELGFIGEKDAKLLQKKLYPRILKIYFQKKQKN